MPPPHGRNAPPLSKWDAHRLLSQEPNLQTRPAHRWTVVRKLGAENRGALNGGVYIVKDHRNKTYIEKRATRAFVANGTVLQEIAILKYLSSPAHPHITRMVDHFVDRARGTASIFLERCDVGGLEGFLEARAQAGELFNEVDVWEWYVQLFDGLSYCHYGPDPQARFGRTKPEDWRDAWDMVFHRDIKVENVLVARGTPRGMTTGYTLKLADFGCAVARRHIWVDREKRHDRASFATWGWMPPEAPQFVGRSDVWQLAAVVGCICNVMNMPFFDHAKPAPGYSDTLNSAIVQSMKKDFKKRPKSDEVLEHVRGKYKMMLRELERTPRPVPAHIDQAKRTGQMERGHKRLKEEMREAQLKQQASEQPRLGSHVQGSGRFGGAGNDGVGRTLLHAPYGFQQRRGPHRGIRRQSGHTNMGAFSIQAPRGYHSDDSLNGASPYMAPYGWGW